MFRSKNHVAKALERVPVNKLARVAVSQKGCVDTFTEVVKLPRHVRGKLAALGDDALLAEALRVYAKPVSDSSRLIATRELHRRLNLALREQRATLRRRRKGARKAAAKEAREQRAKPPSPEFVALLMSGLKVKS